MKADEGAPQDEACCNFEVRVLVQPLVKGCIVLEVTCRGNNSKKRERRLESAERSSRWSKSC